MHTESDSRFQSVLSAALLALFIVVLALSLPIPALV